jgi:hypothetical protein
MAITIIKGNIFNSKAQTIVNTVNCVGVMGKGIALEFKKRYPLKADEVDTWDDITCLNKSHFTIKGKITRTALIILGNEESAHLLSPAVCQIRWSLKSSRNENIDYEILREQMNDERLDEIVEIMLECICSSSKSLIIGKEAVPKEVVKSRFLKINSSHIEYVLNCLDSNTTKVRNIKSYLKTVLYNAPATINSYYAAEVNHDLYGTE